MNNIFELQQQLLEMGYRYFLFENTETTEGGDTIFHYSLFPDSIISRDVRGAAILLDTDGGFDIVEDFLHGEVKVHLYIDSQMHVDQYGELYLHANLKLLKIKSI